MATDSGRRFLAIGLAAAVAAPIAPAQAQDLRVDVTGSNIRRADNETASPMEVVTRDEIARTGALTVNEVLQALPMAGLAIDDRQTNGFTNGAAALNLRNLGFASTLILLNGRRLPTYPFAQRTTSGSQGFQDLNAIPLASVDRIEILKDGMSAIYGADAVGGVVNIIQRSSFQGSEVAAGAGVTGHGDGESLSLSAIVGAGDLARDRYNTFVTADYLKRRATLTRKRWFARDEDLSDRGGTDYRAGFGFPGTIIDTVTGTAVPYATCDPAQVVDGFCVYNRAADTGVEPEVERIDIAGKAEFALTREVTLYAEAMASRSRVFNLGFPAPSSDDPGIGSNLLPVGHPNNPFPNEAVILHRYVDVGNRDTDSRNDAWRAVVGAKGAYSTWDWDAYASLSRIDIDETMRNQVLADVALSTIADGSYDFFRPFDRPDVTARLRYDAVHRGKSTFRDFGTKASGEIARLPAGVAYAAIGAQYTLTDVEDLPDPQMQTSNLLGIGGSAAFGKQSLAAMFGEVVVPVARGVELSGALRHDRYGRSGSFPRTSPKVGIRWQPSRGLLLRATYSEAFRAPSIFETTTSTQSGFEFGLSDPQRCITGSEPDCSVDVRVVQQGNPNLKAETSRVVNVGMVWDVTSDASVSVDAYRIVRDDEIGLFPTQTLINLFGDDPAIVVRTPIGTIAYVNNVPVQLGRTTTSGVDVEGRLRVPIERYGRIEARGRLSYVHDYEFTTIDQDGSFATLPRNGEYGYPRVRAGWEVLWRYGAHEVSLNGWYVHHYRQINPTPAREDVAASAVWNLTWKWDLTNATTASLAVRNLLDAVPAFSNETSATNAGYNPGLSDPRGRTFLAGFAWRLK
jgi:iron complex outermembrane receptor protein